MEFLTQSQDATALFFAFLGSGLAVVLGMVFLRRHVGGPLREKAPNPPDLMAYLARRFGRADARDDESRVLKPADALAQTGDQPMWLRRVSGQMLWSNLAYEKLCAANDWQGAYDPQAFHREDAPVLPDALNCFADSQGGRRRLNAFWDNQDRHFEVSETQVEDGQVFGIANDVSARATAERRMQQFIASLAETFAHVPIGLAIFDERDRLTMFNPALSDLLKLDPAQLARSPEIRDVFEMLRAGQIMPDERTRKDRRRVVKDIIRSARGPGWHAEWALSDQRTIRAYGRAHPNNSVAFLFEDVTKSATLEQKYRGEIDLFHATLDRLDEAVVIFSPSGQLLRANFAFYAMWPQTKAPENTTRDVAAITELCAATCAPNPAWEKLRSFVTSGQSRSIWRAEFDVHNGGTLQGRFAPMPDGSTLVLFSAQASSDAKAGGQAGPADQPKVIGQAPIRWPEPMPSASEAQAVRVLANALVLNDETAPRAPIKVDRVGATLRLTAPRIADHGADKGADHGNAVFVGDDPMAFRIFRRVALSHGMTAEQGPDGAIDLTSLPDELVSKAS